MEYSESSRTAAVISDEMNSLINRHLSKRRPISLRDYDWNSVRSYAVDPDLLESLVFVTLVESNPASASQKLLEAADSENAQWLKLFIDECWLPEEQMHSPLYREYLIRSGTVQQQSIDSEIQAVRERGFEIGTGYTALQGCIFGWLQELITWRYYQAMRNHLLRDTSVENGQFDIVLGNILQDVANQENFHRYFYLTGARTILKHSPNRAKEVISTVSEFVMPGHYMAPEYQSEAPRWAAKFDFPLRLVMQDISYGLVDMVGYGGFGDAIISYVIKNTVPWYIKVPIILTSRFKVASYPIGYAADKVASRLFYDSNFKV